MEFPFYLVITLLCAWVLYWSIVNALRKPGAPIRGLFAYKEVEEDEKAPAAPIDPRRPFRPKGLPSGRWTGRD